MRMEKQVAAPKKKKKTRTVKVIPPMKHIQKMIQWKRNFPLKNSQRLRKNSIKLKIVMIILQQVVFQMFLILVVPKLFALLVVL